jgi:hypothetical protein
LVSKNQNREEIAMAGDPREYRQHAWRCAELAKSARPPELKQTLLNLSSTWLKMAIEFERTHALLHEDPAAAEKPA